MIYKKRKNKIKYVLTFRAAVPPILFVIAKPLARIISLVIGRGARQDLTLGNCVMKKYKCKL